MANLTLTDAIVRPPIIVFGVAGCGKTTLGQSLAAKLGASFLDADHFHSMANVEKMRAGTSLTDEDRAPWLATLNAQLREASARGERVVLACSALKARYREAIARDIAQVVWIFLDGSFELIAARMRARENHYMPESLLWSQFEALERPVNAICISTEMSPTEQIDAVLFALES